jgi:hypothetical protein
MQVRKSTFRSSTTSDWTRERVAQLRKPEIQQLRSNADSLGAAAVVALCDEALRTRPKRSAHAGGKLPVPLKRSRRLISRGRAFEARGVWLQDARTSWGGVRKSDGAVVISIWADAIDAADGSCRYLLWAPNADGSRPWSDKPAGRERLEHCKLATSGAIAEGVLVYGERLDGFLPEDKARSVHGVDPETVLRFKVELRGDEYWAVWGRKPA